MKLNQFLAKFGVFIILFGASLSLSGQQTVSIADEGTITGVSCASSVVITDSDVNNGNYSPNESYVITLCVEEISTSTVEVIISPELYGDTWDVDENSNLFVYDGNSTDAPLLGAFNSITDPAGITVEGSTGCLTLQFISGGESSGEGFTATFTCIQPLQPFLFDLVTEPELETFQDLQFEAIKICFQDSIFIDVNTSYPLSDAGGNGYEQSDETSFFRYLMGDGTIYQGFGLTEIAHAYEDGFGYLVTIIIQDVQGRVESQQIYVLSAPRPNFSNIAVDDTLCIGEQTVITGGFEDGEFIAVDPNSNAILGGGILGEQLYLPDGNDENYETTITIDEFDDGQVIESVSDFINFCINIEHSYLGDLEMMLTCPDGTSINVFNSFTEDGLFPGGFGGGGTFLGDAEDMAANGIPGIGFDYCFAPDAPFGTMGEEFAAGNFVDVSQGQAMAPGTYLPEESFAQFIGCPINGDWTLTVRDNLGIDDGFIFNWSIYFDPDINPSTVYYSPILVDAYWEENDDIISNDGVSITVEPSQEGNNFFTFVAEDEFGCLHDTTIAVYVRPFINMESSLACNLTHTLGVENAPDGGEFITLSVPTSTAQLNYELLSPSVAELTASEYGVYQIEFTDANCAYKDTVFIDFRPDPIVAPFIEDTVLCVGASIEFNAGPQLPNSQNFQPIWTLNGNTFNSEDLSVTVDQTGQYVLTLVGFCSTASDTSDVVAIQIEHRDTVVCGLGVRATVELSPPGNGLWTSENDAISFNNPNELSTDVISSQYGVFPVTFTDTRCPNDGVTRDFRYVKAPEVTILPQNPVFCFDEDSLRLTAVVDGSTNGIFFWTVEGQDAPNPDFDQNNVQVFPPESFLPLEEYVVTVVTLDELAPDNPVCPPGTAELIFEGQACTYNIPNIFTPNGDGRNDRFHVEFIEFFPNTSLRIYNRWGNLVFENSNYDQFQATTGGWDGADVSSGVYFYELTIPYVDKVESGEVTIVKEEGAEQ